MERNSRLVGRNSEAGPDRLKSPRLENVEEKQHLYVQNKEGTNLSGNGSPRVKTRSKGRAEKNKERKAPARKKKIRTRRGRGRKGKKRPWAAGISL